MIANIEFELTLRNAFHVTGPRCAHLSSRMTNKSLMSNDIKRAQTDVDIHPYLKNRWSPRAFSDEPVSREALERLFEAARWAPSSGNEQGWRYILGVKGEGEPWQKILNCLDEANQEWCRHAPVLVACVISTLTSKGKPYKHAGHDLGMASFSLTMQALHENIYVHQMGGFSPDKLRDAFSIPAEFDPWVCMAIGYQGNPERLSEKNQERELLPRKRRALSETAFGDTWGEGFRFA